MDYDDDLEQYARNYLQDLIDEKGYRHKKNKIMLLPMEGTGHLFSLLGLAHYFHQRYHGLVFVVSEPFKKYLENTPFKVRTFKDPAFADPDDPQKRWATNTLLHSIHFRKYPEKQFELQAKFHDEFVTTIFNMNDELSEIIKEEKPELILVDYYVAIPAVITSGIPWGCVLSCNPLCIYRDLNGPPMYSGYGFGAAKSNWKFFKESFDEKIKPAADKLAAFAKERGVILPEGKVWMPSTTYNVYVYPNEVDYTEVSKKTPKYWTRVDHFIRPPEGTPIGFDLTALKSDIKKIYFTLGTMGSADVILMDRLLRMLEKTQHQIIVSKGPNHEKLRLPANAVGGQFINQQLVLPLVDLVLFHGGNNTLVECLYHGKPMVILPLFGDQFDNATRIVDKAFGYAFCPYQVQENELLGAVNDLLFDDRLQADLKKISRRMKRSRTAQRAVMALEALVAETTK